MFVSLFLFLKQAVIFLSFFSLSMSLNISIKRKLISSMIYIPELLLMGERWDKCLIPFLFVCMFLTVLKITSWFSGIFQRSLFLCLLLCFEDQYVFINLSISDVF